MHKPWLAHYPAGIPAEIDLGRHTSLVDAMAEACTRFADRPALHSMGRTMSYRELDEASLAFAAWLQHDAGLARGERVALMMPNLLQYPVVLLGVLRAGLVVVNVNPLYTPRELEHQLQDSGAAAIVVLENFASKLESVVAATRLRTIVTTQVGDLLGFKGRIVNAVVKHVKKMVPHWRLPGAVSLPQALATGRHRALDPVTLAQADLAFLQYTGGTTGVAKGAMLSHGNVLANVLQVGAWLARDMEDGRETVVLPLPLYHVFALMASIVFLRKGSMLVLIANPRDMPDMLKTLAAVPFSGIIGVNTLYRALLDAPGFAAIDLSRLKLAVAGGMAVQKIVAQRWRERARVPLVEGYGLTEASPVAIANPVDVVEWSGTIGMPIPSTDVVIADDEGRVLPAGSVGEIRLRGPQVMQGYWLRPDETAEVLTADGWLRTGDMGTMDEQGFVRITDRKKDMIVVSGFKVFPNEVEDVLAMHPGVREAGAVGVPDEHSGEVVKAVVVRADPELGEHELLAHCRQHLTGYKMPRRIEFRSEPLPRTNVGKILRRELRDAPPATP
ncbi:long-chain-fatty-acid--CoA ligase [Rubrivivax gelatinosus]|nr:long-chain-fatty-acid--CoA ligase [Rubrivivax gelatinosus]